MGINVTGYRQQMIHVSLPDWYLKILFSKRDYDKWEMEINELTAAIVEERVEAFLNYKKRIYKVID